MFRIFQYTIRLVCKSHTPERLSVLDISNLTNGMVSVPKGPALDTSRRVLSGGVLFGIGTLLVVDQSIGPGCRPQQTGVIYTAVYGVRATKAVD